MFTALRGLIEGKPLDGLGLSRKRDRLDLSGLITPEPVEVARFQTAVADVAQVKGIVVANRSVWTGLDFSGAQLNGICFVDCVINNCVFDNCQCREWGLWGTTISDTTFKAADLRRAALGGVREGKRNTYRRVDFAAADLRQIACTAAEFVECTFKDTRLSKIDFQTSSFSNCSFEGELREVLFYRKGFDSESLPPNNMVGVDFTRAKLRFVEFRGLDLEDVRFPADQDHIVLNDYPKTLDRLIQVFEAQSDVASKKLTAYLRVLRKWAGPKQRRGIVNKYDLIELVGDGGLKRFLQVLGQ